jgi:Arc/MetJ family transcription regulator
MMRTTLDIDEQLVGEILKSTGEKNKSRAVSQALESFLRLTATQELRAMAGKIDLVDDLEEMLETQKQRDIERLTQAQL